MSEQPALEALEAAPVQEAVPVDVPVVCPPGGEVITLPSGYQVAIRNVKGIRARERKVIFEGLDFSGGDRLTSGLAAVANVQKLVIVAWNVRDFSDETLEPVGGVLPIPSATPDDVLGGLRLEDAAVLDKKAGELQKLLMPSFDPNPDPASPTPPSAG